MPSTPILGITQVSTSQASKETTINDAIIALESAGNAKLDVNLSAGNVTLTANQATRNYIFKAVSATVARELRFPTTINSNPFNRLFAVRNESGHALTVKFASGAGTVVVIPNNQARLISGADGLNMTVAAEPATVVSFTSLTDVPGSYTGQQGKVLAVNVAENAIEFIDVVSFPSFTGNEGRYLVVNATEDGVVWADASTVTSFVDLTDTPPNYTGQGGKIVSVKGTEDGIEFIDPPEAEAVQFVAATRWRIFVVTAGLEDQVGFGEIEYLDVDNVDLTGTGTAVASNEALGFEAERAFDNITTAGTGWLTEDTYTGDIWIEYEFATPVTPRRVRLRSIGTFAAATPVRFLIQYFDGTVWVDLGDRTAAAWEDDVPQTFRVNGVPLTGVAEAPLDTKLYGRKDGDWEEIVAEVEEAPIDTTPYVRQDGAWEPLPDISSVPDGGTTGQVLTKLSNTDGDADWADATGGGGGGGTLPVATQATAATNLDPAQVSTYVRYTAATAKTVTIRPQSVAALPADGEWTIFNQSAPDLTIVPGAGVSVRFPAGGSLVVPQNGTITLKRVAADSFDIIGQTIGTSSSAFPPFLGRADYVLTVNDTEDDVEWREPAVALPTGGIAGQILTKQSSLDGDADWETPDLNTAGGGSPWVVVGSYNHAVTGNVAFFDSIDLSDYSELFVQFDSLDTNSDRVLLLVSTDGTNFFNAVGDYADLSTGGIISDNRALFGNETFNGVVASSTFHIPNLYAPTPVKHIRIPMRRVIQLFKANSNPIVKVRAISMDALGVPTGLITAGRITMLARPKIVLGASTNFSGALVRKTADQAIPVTTNTIVSFNAEEYDTQGWHDNAVNNSRLTVPAGVDRVRVTARVSRSLADDQLVVNILKNGSSTVIGLPAHDTDTPGSDSVSVASAVMDVVPGDYFELSVFVGIASNVTTQSWFAIEKVSGAAISTGIEVPTPSLLNLTLGSAFTAEFTSKSLLLTGASTNPSGLIGRGRAVTGTTTMTVRLKGLLGEDFNAIGIYASDGTRFVYMNKLSNGGPQLARENWSNRTTFLANFGNRAVRADSPDWMRMIYNSVAGTLRIQISMDGSNWIDFEASNTYLGTTINQMGVCMSRVNAGIGPSMWVDHCSFT